MRDEGFACSFSKLLLKTDFLKRSLDTHSAQHPSKRSSQHREGFHVQKHEFANDSRLESASG